MRITRRSLSLAQSLPPSTPQHAQAPASPPSTRRSLRSSTAAATHHKTADQLALEEAEQLLHHSASTSSGHELRSGHVVESPSVTPVGRTRRRCKSASVRRTDTPVSARSGETSETEANEEAPQTNEEVLKQVDNEDVRATPQRDEDRDEEDQSAEAGPSVRSSPNGDAGKVEGAGEVSEEAIDTATLWEDAAASDQSSPKGVTMRQGDERHGGIETESEDDEESSGSSESEESSDSSDTSESDSEEDSDEEEERLEKLLQAARLSAQAKGKGKEAAPGEGARDGGDEVVLQFEETERERKERPIPDMTVPGMPARYLSLNPDGSARAHTKPLEGPAAPQSGKLRETVRKDGVKAPELDTRPYERELSKTEKSKQPRKATPSELWAKLPAPRAEHLDQMKRDYQALALSNSLDPKRFMKGQTKLTKVPETFAIGTVIERPRHLQDSTIAREAKYRPGDIVKGVVRQQDEEHYAKRKYGDLQWGRMENGRGKGWKKRSKW